MKSMPDIPYARLLQVPEDEQEYLNLDELKPHQITELGILSHQTTSAGHENRLSHSLSNDPTLTAKATSVTTAPALGNQENCIYRLQPSYHQRHHEYVQQASVVSQHHPEPANQVFYDLSLQNNK